MIHTYTARINVCSDFYNQFISHPQTKLYKERGSVHKTAKNGLLSEIGITLYGHKYSISYDRITSTGATEQVSYVNYVIDARVNPAKLIYREKSIDIYKPSDYSLFQQCFNEEIRFFNLPFLPPLDGWKAHRVDFTYNIHTPYVKEYIRLFHKADLRGFTIKEDQHGHRAMKAGSLYINNSAVTLNFYDKQDEMIKAEGGTRHTPEEIQQAKDILRIEVQAGRDKLSGIKRKQEFTTKQISEFMQDPGAAEDLVLMYAEKVLGAATYRKKPAAITLINHSKKHQKTKEQLIAAMEAISKPYKRIDEVRQEHPDLEIDKCKKLLREMDINIVTLDKNSKVKELPSIPVLLREAIEEER
ncbi:MAG: hypothetical protein SOV22_06815 [Blautia obeum]|nr:hypothetical protein [Blautia obeum]